MADQPQDVLRVVNQVASALTAGNPSDAMTPFDKSLAGYSTLAQEFVGLTSAYQVTSEIDVVDEDDAAGESLLTLRWVLTLANNESGQSAGGARKEAEVHVRLRLLKKKWRIVEFTPVNLFTP